MRLTVLAVLALACSALAADTQPAKKTWAEQVVAQVPVELIRTDRDDRVDAGRKIAKMTEWWRKVSSNRKVDFVGQIVTAPEVESNTIHGKVVTFSMRPDPIIRNEQAFIISCRVTMPHSELEKIKSLTHDTVVISGVVQSNNSVASHMPDRREYVFPFSMAVRTIKKYEEPVAAK
jgi:hypothetical protein